MLVRNYIQTEEILFEAVDEQGNLSPYTLHISERSNSNSITIEITRYSLEYSNCCYKKPSMGSLAMNIYYALLHLRADVANPTFLDYCTVIDKILDDTQNQEEK
jgi:hypothetical protein